MGSETVPEMVENVARAMWAAREDRLPETDRMPFDSHGVGEIYVMARAAIEAMREPTNAMIAAGLNERDVNGTGARGLPLCFTRMIDAALAAVDEPDAPAAP